MYEWTRSSPRRRASNAVARLAAAAATAAHAPQSRTVPTLPHGWLGRRWTSRGKFDCRVFHQNHLNNFSSRLPYRCPLKQRRRRMRPQERRAAQKRRGRRPRYPRLLPLHPTTSSRSMMRVWSRRRNSQIQYSRALLIIAIFDLQKLCE